MRVIRRLKLPKPTLPEGALKVGERIRLANSGVSPILGTVTSVEADGRVWAEMDCMVREGFGPLVFYPQSLRRAE